MTRTRPTPADRVFTSRGATVILAIWAFGMMAGRGVSLPCMALTLVVGAAMCVLNKIYNLTHSTSILFAGLYAVLQSGIAAADQSVEGLLYALVAIAATGIMFLCFHAPQHRRTIFLVFLMLGLGSLFSSAYWPLTGLFLIGIANMRALTLRGLTAAALGVLTPAVLLMGYGVIPLSLPAPDFQIITADAIAERPQLFMTGLIPAALCVVFGSVCVLLTYGFQSKPRNYNAAVHLLTLYAMAMFCLDFGRAPIYLPLLMACAAYETSLFVTSRALGYVGGVIALIGWVAMLIINA
jgi:hypothetical protein